MKEGEASDKRLVCWWLRWLCGDGQCESKNGLLRLVWYVILQSLSIITAETIGGFNLLGSGSMQHE